MRGGDVKESRIAKPSLISVVPEWSRRRRRPSGEPEPLPRRPLAGSGKFWILLSFLTVFVMGLLLSSTTFFLGSGSWWNTSSRDARVFWSGAGIQPP